MTMTYKPRCGAGSVSAVILLVILLDYGQSGPVYEATGVPSGRTIRHLPCVARRTGHKGICMFAIDCIKSNGTHLGTCIDKFYFGSCCQLHSEEDATAQLENNSIDENVVDDFQTRYTQSKPVPVASSSFLSSSSSIIFSSIALTTPSTPLTTKTSRYRNTTLANGGTVTTQRTTRVTTKASSPVTKNETIISTTGLPLKPNNTQQTDSPATTTENFKLSTFFVIEETRKNTTTESTFSTSRSTTSTTRPPSSTSRYTSTSNRFTTNKPQTTGSRVPSTTSSRYSTRLPSSSIRQTTTTRSPTTISKRFSSSSSVQTPSTTKISTTTTKRSTVSNTTPKRQSDVPKRSTTTSAVTTRRTTPTRKVTQPSRPTQYLNRTSTENLSRTTQRPSSTFRPMNLTTNSTQLRPEVSTSIPIISTTKVHTINLGVKNVTITTKKPIVTTTTTQKTTAQSTSKRTSPPSSTVFTYTRPLITTPQPSTMPPTPLTTVKPLTSASTTARTTTLTTLKSEFSTWSTVEDIKVNLTSAVTESTVEMIRLNVTLAEPTQITTLTTSARPVQTTTTSTPAPITTTEDYTTNFTTDYSTTPSFFETTLSALEGADYRHICGKRMFPEPRIVGGSKSTFGKWPWQISLRQWKTSTYLHKCGAALLNENWAITAAHCVDNVPPSDLLLRLGEYDLAIEEEPYGYQERRVQIVASHPQFDPRTFEYDLALLRFYEPVIFQPNIIPVCVPDTDENFIGRTAYVTGWGRLYEDGPLPSILQEVSVPVIENSICEGMYRSAGYIEHIPHIFICAGWKKGGFDSCEGDSGGPMVIQRDDKRFILAGVISWGIGCAEPNQPGVYTRITEFKDWINQILQY